MQVVSNANGKKKLLDLNEKKKIKTYINSVVRYFLSYSGNSENLHRI